jgi:hypothetical protein
MLRSRQGNYTETAHLKFVFTPYHLHTICIAPAHARVAVLREGQGPQGGICGMVRLRHAGAFFLTGNTA